MSALPRTDGMERIDGTTSELQANAPKASDVAPFRQFIDWYHPGQARTVESGGLRITVRFVGRKGRRGRIAITATSTEAHVT